MRRFRVVMAVAKKELAQMTRYPTWIIQFIVWPLIFPLIYILSAVGMAGPQKSGLAAFDSVAGTRNYMGFIVIGTMVWMWVNTVMWNFGTFLRDEQMRGTLESNWLCPIKKVDFLIGGASFSMIVSVLLTLVSVIEYRFVYGIHFTGSVLSWILSFSVMIPGVYGLGTMFASLVLWVKETGAAVQLVRGSIMILCGITFPAAIMPGWMQFIAKFMPFTFGISATRTIMINGGSILDALADMLICLGEGFIYMIIGRLCFTAVENKVRNSGSLERF
ncbi:MAG: ABC transporter permease [Clostridiales bacterium]|nr:ABC transporter permease [Clostridiales bacterium]